MEVITNGRKKLMNYQSVEFFVAGLQKLAKNIQLFVAQGKASDPISWEVRNGQYLAFWL